MTYKRITQLDDVYVKQLVDSSLQADGAYEDITSELVAADRVVSAHIITREAMVLCGKAFAQYTLDSCEQTWNFNDGDTVAANQTLCTLAGNARYLLSRERTALNFLQTLSATATTTSQYVAALRGTECKLLDTRKTIPGLNLAQKYAIYCGGGYNHRLNLSAAYLIKENHLMTVSDITEAITQAKTQHPEKVIEVEVENLEEFAIVQKTVADIILLDNFSEQDLQTAVKQNLNHKKLDASGNITLENIASIAKTGVDYIAIGALTKNIKAIDLSMRFIREQVK
jgi:nicotinate-nucleotide pyrophosphorylase (carboxylating)